MRSAVGIIADSYNAPSVSLPLETSLAAWYDGSDASTFTFSSGAIVSQWRTKVGSRHLNVATGGPSRTGIAGGLTCVTFNGTTDCLQAAAPISTATDNRTIQIACKRTGGNATESIPFFNGNPASDGYGVALRAAGSTIGLLRGGIAWHTSAYNDPASPCIITLRRSAGTWSIYLNGVNAVLNFPTDAPNTPSGFVYMPSSFHQFAGDIYEVLFYNAALTEPQRIQNEGYLQRWMVPAAEKTLSIKRLDYGGGSYYYYLDWDPSTWGADRDITTTMTVEPGIVAEDAVYQETTNWPYYYEVPATQVTDGALAIYEAEGKVAGSLVAAKPADTIYTVRLTHDSGFGWGSGAKLKNLSPSVAVGKKSHLYLNPATPNWQDGAVHAVGPLLYASNTSRTAWLAQDPGNIVKAWNNVHTVTKHVCGPLPARHGLYPGDFETMKDKGYALSLTYASNIYSTNQINAFTFLCRGDPLGAFYPIINPALLGNDFNDGVARTAPLRFSDNFILSDFGGPTVNVFTLAGTFAGSTLPYVYKSDGTTIWKTGEVFALKDKMITMQKVGANIQMMEADIPFNPTQLTGLAGWWDADDASTFTYSSGSVVSQWRDKSGNNHHAAIIGTPNTTYPWRGAPVNGHPVLVIANLAPITPLYVTPFASEFTSAEAFFVVGTSGQGHFMDKWTGSGELPWYPWTDSGVYEHWGTDTRKSMGNAGVNYGVSHLYNIRTAPGSYIAAANGNVFFTTATNNVAWGVSNNYEFQSLMNPAVGTIGEIIMYNRVLNAAERTQVEGYLKTKWGIP